MPPGEKRRSRYPRTEGLFAAEAAYAESIFRDALGDAAESVAALEAALTLKPDYAPAILSMGSLQYRRKRRADGKRLFFSLLSLAEETEDLSKIIDEAGGFLIDIEEYADGLELFRQAARRFPNVAEFQEGIGLRCGSRGSYRGGLSSRTASRGIGSQQFRLYERFGLDTTAGGAVPGSKSNVGASDKVGSFQRTCTGESRVLSRENGQNKTVALRASNTALQPTKRRATLRLAEDDSRAARG